MTDYQKIENRECVIDGGTPVSNSGRSSNTNKGDYKLDPFLVDVKYTEKSFSISSSIWAKIQSDAIKNGGREPALKVVLNNEGKTVKLWVVSDIMYKQMREAWLEQNS